MLVRKCGSCHRPGGFAPFSLLSYEDCRKRSELIRYVTLTHYMPPTDAESDYGEVSEHPPITDADAVLIQRWLQSGTPEGLPADRLPAISFSTGWRDGTPDAVFRVSNVSTIAEGPSYWRAYVVPLGRMGRAGIAGFDVRPRAIKAVRHALLAFDLNGDAARRDNVTREPGFATAGSMMLPGSAMIGAWAPGYGRFQLPPGVMLPRGAASSLVIQIQYRPTGKVEDAGFEIGLYLPKQGRNRTANWLTLGSKGSVLEPGESPTLRFERRIESECDLFAAVPEARLFASRIELSVAPTVGKAGTALRIRTWDPYWAGAYCMPNPIRLGKGSKLALEMSYINDKHSVRNEGREPRRVRFGPTLDDEIFQTHVLICESKPGK